MDMFQKIEECYSKERMDYRLKTKTWSEDVEKDWDWNR